MGQVFKARHLRMGRTVAIKMIHRDKLANQEAVRRFEREVRAAAALSHPNIVVAHDADEIRGMHLLVMEYVEGATDLAKLVKQRGPLPVAQACNYIRQAALGLQHAFERGLVHRDIKPQNLLVTADGKVLKILDMGLARLDQTTPETSTMTQEGYFLGTPDYIAPEQAMQAHAVDIRADLYSLGCTFYYLLTGAVPFPGGSLTEKLIKHAMEDPAPLERLRPDVPPGITLAVCKLLAKQPKDRFQTPAELVRALEREAGACAVPVPPAVARAVPAFVGPASPAAAGEATLVTLMPEASAPAAQSRPAPVSDGTLATLLPVASAKLASIGALPPKAQAPQLLKLRWRFALILSAAAALVVALMILVIVTRNRGDQPAAKAPANSETLGLVTGEPMSPLALVTRPARIEGVQSWTIEIRGEKKPVDLDAMTWSADGRKLAVAASDNSVRLWTENSSNPLRTLGHHSTRIGVVAWWPNGKLVTAKMSPPSHGAESLQIWDTDSGESTKKWEGPTTPCWWIAHNAETVAIFGDSHRKLLLWDVQKGTIKKTLTGHTQDINNASWSPQDTLLATAASDGTVRIWDAASGECTYTLKHTTQRVDEVYWSPDGNWVASRDQDAVIRIWKPTSAQPIHTLPSCTDFGWSPDCKSFFTCDTSTQYQRWDTSAGTLLQPLARRPDPATADGKMVYAAGVDGSVRFRDAATDRPRGILFLWSDDRSLAISPVGHYRASASIEHDLVYVVQTSAGQETLNAAEFTQKYGWKNDPKQVSLK